MKKKLYALSFLLGLIVINSLLSYVFINYIVSDSLLMVSERKFKNYSGEIKLLMMGDSHINCGVNPDYIDIKSYNWANPSTKYIHQYYKLKYYLDHKLKEKPKILLINLDVGSLKTRKINRNHYFWVKYLDYFKISKSLPSDERLKFLGNYIKALYAPYLGEHKLLYQWIKTSRKNYGKYSDKGFYLLAKKVKLSPKQKKIKNKRLRRALKNREKSLKRAKTKNKKHIQKEAKEYFIKILELCGKHNIRVMLVICPMKKDLHDMMTRYRSLTNYYAELNKIIKNYNHVELFDYMDIFFKRPDLFIDFYHLNDVGAMEFTKAINRDLTKLLAKWQL